MNTIVENTPVGKTVIRDTMDTYIGYIVRHWDVSCFAFQCLVYYLNIRFSIFLFAIFC